MTSHAPQNCNRNTFFTRMIWLIFAFSVPIAAVQILMCSPASAWNSAKNLNSYCETLIEELDKQIAPLSYRSIVCVTYFEGVGDALLVQGGANPRNSCMSGRYLNLDDLRNPRIFITYMKIHPEKQEDRASDVIRESLEDFCRQQ